MIGAAQTIDRALRTIAQRQAELDAEEARWLREAEAVQIWRPLGMVSAPSDRNQKEDALR